MSKIPKTPQEVFPEIVEDLKGIYGEALQSVILYGSGARGEYVAGKSDINFLVVLAEDAADDLEKILPMIPKWKKRAVATPLFMTKAFIGSSVDVYPVEFLNMKRHYQVVHGEDVLRDLVFERKRPAASVRAGVEGKADAAAHRVPGDGGQGGEPAKADGGIHHGLPLRIQRPAHPEGPGGTPRAAGDRGGCGRSVRDRRRPLPALHRPAGGKEGPVARGLEELSSSRTQRRFKS